MDNSTPGFVFSLTLILLLVEALTGTLDFVGKLRNYSSSESVMED
jgi:hypothetical protein